MNTNKLLFLQRAIFRKNVWTWHFIGNFILQTEDKDLHFSLDFSC